VYTNIMCFSSQDTVCIFDKFVKSAYMPFVHFADCITKVQTGSKVAAHINNSWQFSDYMLR
jgi:hypothetical protein